VAARFTGLSWREATSVGVLMNTRGLMELVVLNVGLDLGVMSPSLFSMMVLMAVVTTVMTTPVLSMVLPPGQTIAERTDTGASGSRSVFVPSHEVHGQPSESEGAAEATG